MHYSPGTLLSSNTFSLSSHERLARFSGWRGGLLLAIIGTSLVLLFNIICAIVAAAVGKPHEEISTLYTGSCVAASRLSTGLHLLINILSSSLLGASSYCMQRLVAPTREEIDKAHEKGKWLDVGVLSLRNLPNISKRRLAVWSLLALSSFPLHFLYNSVVFQTIAANDIDFLLIEEAFLTTRGGWEVFNSQIDLNYEYGENIDDHYQGVQETLLNGQYLNTSRFENISATECLKRYSQTFITAGNGFAILPIQSSNDNTFGNNSIYYVLAGTGQFKLPFNGTEVLYCLSEISPQRCRVQLSQNIMYIVIACNMLKIALMFVVLRWMNHKTIVTIGDAIETFIRIPDDTTKNCCLMATSTVKKRWKSAEARSSERYQSGSKTHWYNAISGKRWLFSLVSYVLVIAAAGVFYRHIGDRTAECHDRTPGSATHWKVCRWNSFGNVDFLHARTARLEASRDVQPLNIALEKACFLLSVYLGFTSIIPYVLLANTPQVIASFLYLSYNGLFTAMVANREWTSYAQKRATLRVTVPTPSQRSTYFLSLPYKYSSPLIIASILLHWFISQTLFIARIDIYRDGVLTPTSRDWWRHQYSVTDLGFSDSALIATIVMASLLVAVCMALAGVCTYPKGMPHGGTNSAIISAACHVKQMDGAEAKGLDEIVERPLQWGVTIEGTKDQVGHCSFSDRAVLKPVRGCLYA